jgi:hypothetical protein
LTEGIEDHLLDDGGVELNRHSGKQIANRTDDLAGGGQ